MEAPKADNTPTEEDSPDYNKYKIDLGKWKDINEINNKLATDYYDKDNPFKKVIIGSSVGIVGSYSTAIIALNKSDLDRFNYQVGDTEGVVNFPLSMSKIKMAVLVTERQDQIRLSFRSKGSFSVHELANKYFKGGGHTNAAGGTLTCSFEEAMEQLKSVLPEYKEKLNQAE